MADISIRAGTQAISLMAAQIGAAATKPAVWKPAAMAGSVVLRDFARSLVHVDTRRLQKSVTAWVKLENGFAVGKVSSLHAKLLGQRGSALRLGRRVRNNKGRTVYAVPYYGRFLEEGTRKMQAYPFLAPAADRGEQEAIGAVEEAAFGIMAALVRSLP